MSPATDPLDDLLSHAAELAHHAEPPPLPAAELDRMVGLAVAARHLQRAPTVAEAPKPATRQLRWIAAAAAIGLAFAAGHFSAGAPAARPHATAPHARGPVTTDVEPGSAEHRPGRLELPNGDRLSPASGTGYSVEGTPQDRVLRVRAGALLVDAAHRARGAHLSVVTPHGDVHVVGTVFTVDVDDERTVVRVYEGQVVVSSGTDERSIREGGSISLRQGAFELPPPPTDNERALAIEAAEAVGRRVAEATTGSSPPDVAVAEEDPRPTHPVAAGLGQTLGDPSIVQGTVTQGTVTQGTVPGEASTNGAAGSATPRPAFARLWIADGQPARALAAAQNALQTTNRHEPTWRMVEGDALVALDRPGEATLAYESAAAGYGPALAARAAVEAAELRFSALGDPTGALRVLLRFEAGAEPVTARRIERLRELIRERRNPVAP